MDLPLYIRSVHQHVFLPLTNSSACTLIFICSSMDNSRIYRMTFASVYPLYLAKAGRKGRTKSEVDEIISWLTGYTANGLQQQIDSQVDFENFFLHAPKLNPNINKIKGVICGYRVEDIEDPLVQKVRYLDKLIDELAKGRSMEKILRS